MVEDTQMLTPKQVAEILGVHQKTVHLWLRSGRLQGIKISYRAWRIPKTALDSFITSNSNTRLRQHAGRPQGTNEQLMITTDTGNQRGVPGENQIDAEVSPQSRMKHYIRDIMGEQTSEE